MELQNLNKQEVDLDIFRGDIYLADYYFDNSFRTKPVLVIQNNIGNKYSPLVIVVPIVPLAMEDVGLPMNVIIDRFTLEHSGLQESSVLLNIIMTIEKSKLREKLGRASGSLMKEVEKGILISLGIKGI